MGAIDRAAVSELVTLRHGLAEKMVAGKYCINVKWVSLSCLQEDIAVMVGEKSEP